MLLGIEDLQKWTGYKGKARIIKFLEKNGIAHTVGRSGAPMTTQAAIEKVFGGTKQENEKQREKFEFM